MSILDRRFKLALPTSEEALPGRVTPVLPRPQLHHHLGRAIHPPFPVGHGSILLGMGCFWGAERLFWRIEGVWTTSVGYAGGHTPNPTYEEVCSGRTGHTEVVQVVFDPQKVSLATLLAVFWESHNPTLGMRQGNDVGTQYRSWLGLASDEDFAQAVASRDAYQQALHVAGAGEITTEIVRASAYYLAEDDHQQYLSKNPWGYCGLQGTGVSCSTPPRASG